jgi:hypothetical protein
MTLDLSGLWRFQLDPDDRGLDECWQQQTLVEQIELPGSLQSQGHGDDVRLDTQWVGNIIDPSYFADPKYAPYREADNIKVPFWLQPEKHYSGAAWYQREVEIPAAWQGRRVLLTLERPHWETTLWLDDRLIGSNNSLAAPHVYDLGAASPGRRRITVRVDNRMIIAVGPNAHSISDHTQSNWNGIVGRIELSARAPVWISDVQVYPDISRKAATVKINAATTLSLWGSARVRVSAERYNVPGAHTPPAVEAELRFAVQGGLADLDLAAGGGHVDVDYPLGEEAALWDEFHPALYRVTVDLEVEEEGVIHRDQRILSFGLRQIAVEGTQITVNGRKTFLRGTLECCIFPLTGYPPTDVESWKRIVGICKAHGLNQIRFHSWCPPEAAFVAADELGFYYQVECPSWANQGAAIGEGRPLDGWLYQEGWRLTEAYGNHPSFVMMAYGNEPAGRIHEFLGEWVTYWRRRDPRRIHTGGAGWPVIPENQYHNIPEPRVQRWGEEIRSRINANPPETLTDYRAFVERLDAPIVSHEIGQWCVYPNFAEIDKYTGVLKAKNFEIFRDFLTAAGMGDQAHDFLIASGKLQALCYKEDIEAALRTPGFAGFQLLDLHDFPGQGTALVGVLDPFWDEKGYISAAEFSRFCNSTVPLARLPKRYWTSGETLTARIDVAHFGPADLDAARVRWSLLDEDGEVAAHGEFAPQRISIGNDTTLGTVEQPLSGLLPAQRYRLAVTIDGGEEAISFTNDWDLWLFAEQVDDPGGAAIHETAELDDAALAILADGGRVLLHLDPAQVDTDCQIGFSTVFWNTAWTRNQAPHTLGILCAPDHAIFAHFPTEAHSNWQWWELIHGSAAMILDDLPSQLRPLIQPIDTWFEARRLGLLFEATVNGGKLMISSMDLHSNLAERHVARQLRHSLLHYLQSDQFSPNVELTVDQVKRLLRG